MTYYQLQRSTPGHKSFRDNGDPWRTPETAAYYAVRALCAGLWGHRTVSGLVVRILPFEV